MSKWADNAITKHPKADAPTESWWAKPEFRDDRAAFQKRLVDSELARMTHARFGGHGKIHGDGST